MLPIPTFLSPQRGMATPAVAAINHLLAREEWARDTLKRHAGKTARISFDDMGEGGVRGAETRGYLALSMRVAIDGMLEVAGPDDVPSVTIHIKPADLPLILQQRDRAFSYVRIDGDAEFANTISQLSKGMRWDAEHDIERVFAPALGPTFGPILARRLVGGTRGAAHQAADAGRRLAENVAEFLLEERQVLVRPAAVDAFGDDINRLRDDIERTAKRIARLEQKLAQQQTQQQTQQQMHPQARIPSALPTATTTDTTAPGSDIR